LDHRRRRGEIIVFTNGCFDVLHVGHVRYLRSARREGDVLVVGLNTDRSVREIKGPGRPVHPAEARAEILAAYPFIDYLIIFNAPGVWPRVRRVRRDVMVKGGDCREGQVVGGDFARSCGGRAVVLAHVPGRSTTETLRRLTQAADPGLAS